MSTPTEVGSSFWTEPICTPTSVPSSAERDQSGDPSPFKSRLDLSPCSIPCSRGTKTGLIGFFYSCCRTTDEGRDSFSLESDVSCHLPIWASIPLPFLRRCPLNRKFVMLEKRAPPLPSLPLWRWRRFTVPLFGLRRQIGASESGKKCILPLRAGAGSFFFNLSLEDICGHPQTLRPHAQLHTLRFAQWSKGRERGEGDPSSRTKPFLQSPPPPPPYHSARSSSPPTLPSQSQCCE